MKPKEGAKITFTEEGALAMDKKPGAIAGVVDSVDGNLCIFRRSDNGQIDRFIYKFEDVLNRYFNWTGRYMYCLTVTWVGPHHRAGEVFDRKSFDSPEDRDAYIVLNRGFYPYMTEIKTYEDYDNA